MGLPNAPTIHSWMSVTSKVKTQHKVQRTDATTLRACHNSKGQVSFTCGPVASGPGRTAACLEHLVNGCFPGAAVCGEGCRQAVFEPLKWATNVTPTSGQLREEDHLRKVGVVHRKHISNLPQLCVHDECLNAWPVVSAQQFCVGDFIFPRDAHDLAKSSEVKLIECIQLISVECPSLTAVEQGNDNNCLVHLHFSTYCDGLAHPILVSTVCRRKHLL